MWKQPGGVSKLQQLHKFEPRFKHLAEMPSFVRLLTLEWHKQALFSFILDCQTVTNPFKFVAGNVSLLTGIVSFGLVTAKLENLTFWLEISHSLYLDIAINQGY
jgi:hypothetical protein